MTPDDSQADVPFDHPFGFDWEFSLALDDEYTFMLSPANAQAEGGDGADPISDAKALGLTVPPNGLLGVEWDKNLLPQSFRNQVNTGDRVAVFGRWILDEGHDVDGRYRTEIHPPLLMATASIQPGGNNPPFTRVVFMSRPYLVGQTFCVDPKNAYLDGVDDDGSYWDHLIKECIKVIGPPIISWLGIGESWKVEAHPKIKSFPFKGVHLFRIRVRPPDLPPHHRGVGVPFSLATSFQFTVRSGCTVQVTSSASDAIDVFIVLNSASYTPPPLPHRKDHNYSRSELDRLSAGSGTRILEFETLMTALGLVAGGPIDAVKVGAVLSTGILTDDYDPLPEINVLDGGRAANFSANNIPDRVGVAVDNNQHYPIFGWLEAKWVAPGVVATT